jgi:hypothetical protein
VSSCALVCLGYGCVLHYHKQKQLKYSFACSNLLYLRCYVGIEFAFYFYRNIELLQTAHKNNNNADSNQIINQYNTSDLMQCQDVVIW